MSILVIAAKKTFQVVPTRDLLKYKFVLDQSNCAVESVLRRRVGIIERYCIFQCHSNETLGNVRQKIANRLSKTPEHIQVVAQDKLVVSHLNIFLQHLEISRTLMAQTLWNHENMFETGVVRTSEC